MDRNTLVSNQVKITSAQYHFKLILDYNVHRKKFEKLVQKDLSKLKQDKTLGPFLLIRLQFIYKKAFSLRDRLTPGVIDLPIQAESRLFSFFERRLCLWPLYGLQAF